jgi:DNA-binding transcriptional LysR family regulator
MDRVTGETGLSAVLQSRLKIRHLVLLTTVSDCLSLSKAATVLNMTQSAVTKSLRELEDSLDVKLFIRSARGVAPTNFGRSLIHHARAILSEVHSAADDIDDIKVGTSGQVVIGTLRLAAPTVLPRALIQLRKKYPRLTVAVVEGNFDPLRLGLRTGEIDLLFGYLSDSRPLRGLVQEQLYRDSICFIVRPRHMLLDDKGISLASIFAHQWILPPRESLVRRSVDAVFRAAGCDSPSCAIESVTVLLTQALLAESDMIAAVPGQVAQQLASRGLAAILPVRIESASLPVGILMASDRQLTPPTKTLIDLLRRSERAAPLDAPNPVALRETKPVRSGTRGSS